MDNSPKSKKWEPSENMENRSQHIWSKKEKKGRLVIFPVLWLLVYGDMALKS